MKFHKDNRIAPPIVSFFTVWLIWILLDRTAHLVSLTPDEDTRRQPEVTSKQKAANKLYTPIEYGQHPVQGPGPGTQLDSDDVLLILKTGATVLWRRLPIHLTTSLSPGRIDPRNTVIYSEVEASLGNHTVIDILSEMPQSVKDSTPFDTHTAIREWKGSNSYLEQTGLAGDDEGPPGAWQLDKYTFLPLMQHAGINWPTAKWYLYTEDDTYLFLPNVLRYLSAYDHRESHWLGGRSKALGTTFAHGESGFALSRAAWEQSFGKGGDLVKKYQSFVDEAGSGDYALGKVLNDFGVKFGENHGDEGWSWGFNSQPHWKTVFSRDNWCLPVLTWSHAHSREIASFHRMEKSWDPTVSFEQTPRFERSRGVKADACEQKPLNYGDFYTNIMAPALIKRKRWWDNLASRYEVHASSASSSPRPDSVYDNQLWTDAWKSVDTCEQACDGWSQCVQWYYDDDDCRMDDRVIMGHGYPKGMRYRKEKLESVSGWRTDRIKRWQCD